MNYMPFYFEFPGMSRDTMLRILSLCNLWNINQRKCGHLWGYNSNIKFLSIRLSF